MFLFTLDGVAPFLFKGLDGLLMGPDISDEYTLARWESDKNKTFPTPDCLQVSWKDL